MPHDAYIAAKREIVVTALAKAGVKAEVAAVIETPPRSRRRAVLKLARTAAGMEIGFHAARSHAIVDMRECLVLTPGLFGLVQELRPRLLPIFHEGEHAELHVTECDNGFDCALRWERKRAPDLVAQFARGLKGLSIARLVLNRETVLEDAAPFIGWVARPDANRSALRGADAPISIQVKPPPQAFLQPTRAGEAALQEKVLAMTAKAKTVADLFCGLGTFTLPLAARAKVHAVESDKPMLDALAAAARNASGLKPLTTEARDLFRNPLSPPELAGFDAVVLDPPAPGPNRNAGRWRASKVRRLAYVSCDAQTFARDAAILAAGGFIPGLVTPVDQFLFSSHIELVADFRRA